MRDLSFSEGFSIGAERAAAAQRMGVIPKVFDWHKAADLIREHKPRKVYAGLQGDWGCTCGLIFSEGKSLPCRETSYLRSNWALPLIELDGKQFECWVLDTPRTNPEGWEAQTFWPPSALARLGD